MSDAQYTVIMNPNLLNQLDEAFGPLEGIAAIDQMFLDLPLLHPATSPKRAQPRLSGTLMVYRGIYAWDTSLGFSYVQIGTRLHVLELWFNDDPDCRNLDVVLGRLQPIRD